MHPLRDNWCGNFALTLLAFGASLAASPAFAHAPPKPVQSLPQKPPAAESSAQIELLETYVRFETDGSSRREVHTRVHILSETGVREFGRLTFDYNRSFEQLEIPLVRVTHSGGGTADILPGAISDEPNPAAVNAPAYHDVRRKSVRILGLEPGDLLEYRVVTSTTHHPLSPDFWLAHSFARDASVSQEIYEVDLPASRPVEIRINPSTPPASTEKSGEGDSVRIVYRWQRSASKEESPTAEDSAKKSDSASPDLALSTFGTWVSLSIRLAETLAPGAVPLEKIANPEGTFEELEKPEVTPEMKAKADQLAKSARTNREKLEAIYDFVSQKIATVDLPLGSTGFLARPAEEILSSGYATSEDKFVLLAALSSALRLHAGAALTGYCDAKGLPQPSVFNRLLVSVSDGKTRFWLDPSLEVAPLGMISPASKQCAFVLERTFFVMSSTGHEWQPLSPRSPFPASQRVNVDASIAADGKLTAKVHYRIRGDNELLLRLAFHRTPKEKWKDVARLLALSDGFRGQVTSATASDPYATRAPFTVEYEISQPNFVDWKKQPVRIPALLPEIGLPDLPSKPGGAAKAHPIDLGTPLDVRTSVTLRLPPDTIIRPPVGSSVSRDYAVFSSAYSAQHTTLTASRHLKFILRELPASRAADYSAFVHAVQTDEAQDFTLEREATSTPRPQPVAPKP